MANFFSLGSCSSSTPQQQHPQPSRSELANQQQDWNSGVLLYRNEEIYQKGFEIWQQYVQVHHPKSPFLLHHRHHHHHVAQSGGSNAGNLLLGGGGMNCQDCGNQAKKDCAHSRCRTCCKSRGFDCPTHVKSTWVPAAQRRERQNRLANTLRHRPESSHTKGSDEYDDDHHSNQNSLKRQREEETTGLELGQNNFPAEISAAAVFRCVRVHSTQDAADQQQLAYQTAVNINGRLFKGILYDQGPDRRYPVTATTAPAAGPGAAREQSETATCLDPNTASNNGIYPPAISAFLAGTQFFPTPRS